VGGRTATRLSEVESGDNNIGQRCFHIRDQKTNAVKRKSKKSGKEVGGLGSRDRQKRVVIGTRTTRNAQGRLRRR